MHTTNGLWFLLLVGFATACTPAVTDGTSGTGGTGGTGGAAGPDPCEAFPEVPAVTDVLVRIVNQRMTPIFVDTDCSFPFDIEVGGVTHPGGLSGLGRTCFKDRTGPPGCCDCDVFGMPIAAGASWEAHWPGLYYDMTEMPVACYSNLPNSLSAQTLPMLRPCAQPTPAMPGPMRLLAHLYQNTPMSFTPIEATKDFVLGTDGTVELVIQ
jgi:hypothetical protein